MDKVLSGIHETRGHIVRPRLFYGGRLDLSFCGVFSTLIMSLLCSKAGVKITKNRTCGLDVPSSYDELQGVGFSKQLPSWSIVSLQYH